MLERIVNKLWPLLEPKFKVLVDEAVDRGTANLVNVVDQKTQSLEDTVLAALRKLPIVGGLI